jgi:riboflavin kinase/FMN adenylyltransferase
MPERFRDWSDSGLPPNSPGTVVTVGTFDGVHLGHRDVLTAIARRAGESELQSVLVTFDPHPLEVVNPAAAPLLLTVGAEKLEIVAQSGIHYMAVLPFTAILARYSAAQFVDEVLRRRFHIRQLVIGYDHGFGRAREGDVEVLRRLGAERGFRVDVVGPVAAPDGRPISSTMIRRAVAGGDLMRAAAGLGRLYSVTGRVEPGAQRGRLLGFPTINLAAPPPRKLLPPAGVYAVRTQTPLGPYGGMMSLGPRPTFGETATTLEVHLFGARADLYGAVVKVEFVTRLRDIVKFPGAAELVAQLRRDEEQARHALTLLEKSPNLQDSLLTPTYRA